MLFEAFSSFGWPAPQLLATSSVEPWLVVLTCSHHLAGTPVEDRRRARTQRVHVPCLGGTGCASKAVLLQSGSHVPGSGEPPILKAVFPPVSQSPAARRGRTAYSIQREIYRFPVRTCAPSRWSRSRWLPIPSLPPRARMLDIALSTSMWPARWRPACTIKEWSSILISIRPCCGWRAAAGDAAGLTIEWVQGDAQALPFPDASFDLVFCQQGIQFFPDQSARRGRGTGCSAPGGEVAVACWRGLAPNLLPRTWRRWCSNWFGSDALAPPFALDDPLELAALLQQAAVPGCSRGADCVHRRLPDPDRVVEMQMTASAAGIRTLRRSPSRAG